MRIRFTLAVLGGLMIGLGFAQISTPPAAHSQEAKGTKVPAETTELDGLKSSAVAFEKAFNAGDAKAIAAQFSEKAEVVDEDGDIVEGRANIEARFAEIFKDNPKARIEVELTSLRQLGPDVAVEDGFSTTTLNPGTPGARSPYTLVHVKRDGKWLVASVRDFPAEAAEATAHDRLSQLEWLVGHWVDESPDGRVETTCQWSEDGNYLLQEYVVKTRRGVTMKGTQRIGWDGLRRTIRSWAFDQGGAFTEATWTPIEDAWILKVEGVTASGDGASVTRVITPITSDSYHIDSTSFIVDNELYPDTSVRVVRRPPVPVQQPSP